MPEPAIAVAVVAIITAIGGVFLSWYKIRKEPSSEEAYKLARESFDLTTRMLGQQSRIETELRSSIRKHEECRRRLNRLEMQVAHNKTHRNDP